MVFVILGPTINVLEGSRTQLRRHGSSILQEPVKSNTWYDATASITYCKPTKGLLETTQGASVKGFVVLIWWYLGLITQSPGRIPKRIHPKGFYNLHHRSSRVQNLRVLCGSLSFWKNSGEPAYNPGALFFSSFQREDVSLRIPTKPRTETGAMLGCMGCR